MSWLIWCVGTSSESWLKCEEHFYCNGDGTKSSQSPRGSYTQNISASTVSVGGCEVIAKRISLQATLLHWCGGCVDLDSSYCLGERSPLVQHNSANNSHWLYPTLTSVMALSLRCERVKCISRKRKVRVYHITKPVLVPGELCLYKTKHKILCFPIPVGFKCSWQNKDMMRDLSLLVRVGTGTEVCWCHLAVTMAMMRRFAAIYGCPDSCHPPQGKWLGTARPHIRPGTEAEEWTRHAGLCQRGLSRVWVYVCECVCARECVCVWSSEAAPRRDQEQGCVC